MGASWVSFRGERRGSNTGHQASQTPQHFYNPDPIQHNLLASASVTDEQRSFFDIIQPSRDAWDMAFCCGTSAMVRRSCLDRIGGFPVDAVTEDCLLSYCLMDEGYITRYLDERLVLGCFVFNPITPRCCYGPRDTSSK